MKAIIIYSKKLLKIKFGIFTIRQEKASSEAVVYNFSGSNHSQQDLENIGQATKAMSWLLSTLNGRTENNTNIVKRIENNLKLLGFTVEIEKA